MVSYNPEDWLRFLFRFHRADTFRKLWPLLAVVAFYAGLLAFLELRFLPAASPLRHLSILHTLLGFAISMLLVFRTNTAYDRWWEGRKQWGALVNNSRNLAIKLDSMLAEDDENNRQFFIQAIPRFALELMVHLRSEATRYALDELPHPEIPDFDRSRHGPNEVAGLLASRIQQLYRQKILTDAQLLMLNPELSGFADVCGACERIKNTPIPYSYSGFIKRFLFFYILTLPIGYVFNLGYWIVPVVVLVLYVLGSLELIAEEIEDPFGLDSNDLPMERLCSNIVKHIGELLERKS